MYRTIISEAFSRYDPSFLKTPGKVHQARRKKKPTDRDHLTAALIMYCMYRIIVSEAFSQNGYVCKVRYVRTYIHTSPD